MASIQDLKKDINFLATEIIAQCYIKQLIRENLDEAKVTAVITAAIDFRNEFITRANHPDGKENTKLVKNYYQSLRKDLMQQFAKLAEQATQL